ncbi:hypothetical protein BSNK01_01270 [Bacillaceae bacterium]
MRIFAFRLLGKMAHFRCYYSNSTALTYSVPPRTTIAGILAGLLGIERDAYYDLFSLDQCKIAVGNRAAIKKQVQKLNLLMIKSVNDYNGSQEHHSQTPTELVLPQNIRAGHLDYHVWVWHRDADVSHRLLELFQTTDMGFASFGISLALGSAQHLGWLHFEGLLQGEEVEEEKTVTLSSVVPVRRLKRLDFSAQDGDWSARLVKEDLPLEFDAERRLTERGKGQVIINLLPHPIRASVSGYVRLNDGTAITWLD